MRRVMTVLAPLLLSSPVHAAVPTAANIWASTSVNTPITLSLYQASTGHVTGAQVVGTVASGSVTLQGLMVTFKPVSGFTGCASFDFLLSNKFGNSNTANVSIMVKP